MSEPIHPSKIRPGMRPWVKALLFASLAVNLAVAGLVIGAVLRFGPFDGRHPPRMDSLVGPYTHALSREDKRAIARALREEYRAARPSRAQMQAQFDAVVQALRATPYDRVTVEQSLLRQQQLGIERQELGQRLLLERLNSMSDAERAAFADRLEEGLKKYRESKPGHSHKAHH